MFLDFSRQNLRGRNFKGQNLTGANFSGANVRGVNFTNAVLTGADFSDAEAGLPKCSMFMLIGISGFLWLISGYVLATAGAILGIGLGLGNFPENFGLVILVVLVVFFITTIFQGLVAATWASTVSVLAIMSVYWVILSIGSSPIVWIAAIPLAIVMAAALIAFVAVPISGVWLGSIAGTLLRIVTETVSGIITVVITLFITCITCIIGAFWSAYFFLNVVAKAVTGNMGPLLVGASAEVAVAGAAITTICMVGLAFYNSWRSLSGDEKYNAVGKISIALAAKWGTTFQSSDLTNANFTRASFKNTDFRRSNITHTRWLYAKNLNLARLGGTYLKDENVRKVLTTGEGKDGNFNRKDLRGVNFQGFRLEYASFIDTDLSQANLQEANLFEAKLVRTNLDRSNLSNACLTGAYIEDWGITRKTRLEGVECKYIYLKLPTTGDRDPNRMPPSEQGDFGENDFNIFITSVLDTLDLYHKHNINAGVAITVLKGLTLDYPVQFELVGLEKRGNNQFLIRLKVFGQASHFQLQREYYARYEQTLPLYDPKKLMPDTEVIVEEIIKTVQDNPGTRIENLHNEGIFITGGQVNMTAEQSRTINMGSGNYNERIEGNYIQGDYREGKQSHFNLQGAQFAGGLVNADTVNAHQIGGNITNDNSELTQASVQIQQLLEQLEQTYPSNTTTGKMTIATEAIKYIESDRALAQRILSAIKADGTEALAQFLNHPAASFVIGALDDWQKTKGS